jgi:hypothetical protein
VKKTSHHLAWLAVGVVGALVFAWAYPRAYPTIPKDWQVRRQEAVRISLERLRDLGDPVPGGYVVTRVAQDEVLERRLRRSGAAGEPSEARATAVTEAGLVWEITVFARGAKSTEWTYRARIAPSGSVTALSLNLPESDGGGEIEPSAARARADAFLSEQGFDLARFAEPELRSVQLQERTDRAVRYRDRGGVLGEAVPYGVEVSFAGERLTGYRTWYDDPQAEEFTASLQPVVLTGFFWRLLPMLLLPVVGLLFLRRYHAGEIGVRRGLHLFAVSIAFALVVLVLCGRTMAAEWNFGILSRQQTTWAVGLQVLFFFFFPLAGLSFLTWSVGEATCRERAAWRLAAFDALLQGQWQNSTVAREALRGTAAGIALAAAVVAAAALLPRFGGWSPLAFMLGPWWEASGWFGLALLGFVVTTSLYSELFGRLFLASVAERRLGVLGGGLAAAVVGAFLFYPLIIVLPWSWNLPFWLATAGVLVALFFRYGLATSVLASLVSTVAVSVYPFLVAEDPWLQFQACLPLLAVALPFLVSLRHLTSEQEFVYRWDDVPPHVRRIAERERQRVELETARRIQSSILPELPAQLNGVEIAHAYLPATEVGGDFYDVLALADGRLAVAVGDVAGHGVSSGLVMSMARSALAVQVTFDPEVEAVFSALNRVVYQSARKRLLATLCYALLDPRRRELLYASAGHLYPYLIARDGRVQPLEFVAYPLGVRGSLKIEARHARLQAGDTLFLLSDGLVEARAPDSDEVFGFERLEASLVRHADLGVARLRDAVLADVARHSGGAPREDDQTVLVLRVP